MSSPNLFFPTPVWVTKIDKYKETNEEIYKYIKNLREIDEKGIIKSNIKGWHSNDFDLKDIEVKNFINLISPQINKALVDMNWDINNQLIKISSMWAIINIGGAAMHGITMAIVQLCTAYYVRAPKNSGDLVFYDPRPAPVYSHPHSKKPNHLNAMVNSVSPVEGALVLFPSYLDHSVNENISNEERIVISFNVTLSLK